MNSIVSSIQYHTHFVFKSVRIYLLYLDRHIIHSHIRPRGTLYLNCVAKLWGLEVPEIWQYTPNRSAVHHRTYTHTKYFHTWGQVRVFNQLSVHVFGLWEKPKYLEETHIDTARRCKLGREKSSVQLRSLKAIVLTTHSPCQHKVDWKHSIWTSIWGIFEHEIHVFSYFLH